MASIINADTSGGLKTTADTSGVLQLQSAGTATVTIDTSGNVGVGTTSPSYKMDVRGTIGTNNNIAIEDSSNTYGYTVGRGRIISNGSGGAGGLTFQSYNGGFYSTASIDSNAVFAFNSGYGSVATVYGCRAWVNFNGSGSITVNGSGNISSVVRNGTGDYTINFTNSMPDANYSVTQAARPNTTGANTAQMRVFGYTSGNNQAPAASNFRVGFCVQGVNNAQDCDYVCLAVFR